ncbi:MAG: hypothetical protein L3J70_02565 [Gammaproteobacteria bacterium]|nr:hypothetical protein [Gammaproteobacteria bacterium]
MILTLSIIVVSAILALTITTIHCKRSALFIRHQRQGIGAIGEIRKLIEFMPQHRGMSNSLLLGDDSFKEKIIEVQNKVDKSIQEIDKTGDIEGKLLRWKIIKADWVSLKNCYSGLSASKSFQQHSDLINEVLYLIVDVANDSGLYFHEDKKCRDLTVGLFYYLPMMIEFVARARGVGAGVAAQNRVIISARIKLQFLHKRVNKSLESIHSTLAQSLADTSYQGQSPEVLITEGLQPTYFFMHILQENLLGERGVAISSTEYFDAGTSAISTSFELFDTLIPIVNDYSDKDEVKLKRQIKWLWFFGFIITGATAFFVLI